MVRRLAAAIRGVNFPQPHDGMSATPDLRGYLPQTVYPLVRSYLSFLAPVASKSWGGWPSFCAFFGHRRKALRTSLGSGHGQNGDHPGISGLPFSR
jgi:hypothetical protein